MVRVSGNDRPKTRKPMTRDQRPVSRDQEHAYLTRHSRYGEDEAAVLRLECRACGRSASTPRPGGPRSCSIRIRPGRLPDRRGRRRRAARLFALVRAACALLRARYESEDAWITAFGIERRLDGRGLGTALLGAALDASRGWTGSVSLSRPMCRTTSHPAPTPRFIRAASSFLTKRGFEVIERPISMRAELTGFRVPDDITVNDGRARGEGDGDPPGHSGRHRAGARFHSPAFHVGLAP